MHGEWAHESEVSCAVGVAAAIKGMLDLKGGDRQRLAPPIGFSVLGSFQRRSRRLRDVPIRTSERPRKPQVSSQNWRGCAAL
jgi:hypothetical protein